MTLRDVAAASGVSISTASIALRGHGSVLPATRARILEAARRLGYAPDPAAARLSTRRFSQSAARSGLSIVMATHERVDSRSEMRSRLRARATELGYTFREEILPLDEKRLAATLRRWRRQGVAALALCRQMHELPIHLEEWRHFALISFCGTVVTPPCHRVNTDPGAAVVDCWRILRSKGYRDIGLAISRHAGRVVDDDWRLAAALLLQSRLGPGERVIPIFLEPLGGAETPDRFAQWFAKHRPDAIIGFTICMQGWLEERGWRCPGDFAFASLHHLPYWPSVSGYDTMTGLCAKLAMERLDQLVRQRETGWPAVPSTTLIPSQWIEGESTPAASSRVPNLKNKPQPRRPGFGDARAHRRAELSA